MGVQGLSRVLPASQQGLELGTQEACGQLGALQAPGKEPQVPGGPSGRQESRRNAGRGKRRPRPATNVGERAGHPHPQSAMAATSRSHPSGPGPVCSHCGARAPGALRGRRLRTGTACARHSEPGYRQAPRGGGCSCASLLRQRLLGRKETFKKCSQAHTQRESLLHASQRPRGVQSGPRCLLYSKYADGSAARTLHTHTTRTSGGLPFFVAAIILGFRSN